MKIVDQLSVITKSLSESLQILTSFGGRKLTGLQKSDGSNEKCILDLPDNYLSFKNKSYCDSSALQPKQFDQNYKELIFELNRIQHLLLPALFNMLSVRLEGLVQLNNIHDSVDEIVQSFDDMGEKLDK